MNNLAIELYFHIFEYLNIEDLFNLRLVCAKFESVLREFRIKELVFYQSNNSLEYRRRWFYINQPISQNYLIKHLSLFNSSIFDLSFLKYLKIDLLEGSCKFKLKDLQKLNHLEDLGIKIGLKMKILNYHLKILKH